MMGKAETRKNRQLYELMLRKGYPEEFAALIADEMCTEFTSARMIGYIVRNDLLPLEEVADYHDEEMLKQRLVDRKEASGNPREKADLTLRIVSEGRFGEIK